MKHDGGAHRTFAFALVMLTASCATDTKFDPYGRPYRDEQLMRPLEMKACQPDDLDRKPRLVFGTRPLYPIGEHLGGRMGAARVAFEVQTDGSARYLAGRAENRWFGAHSALALKDWKFEPAQKAGQAVAVTCLLEFSFITWSEGERREILRRINGEAPAASGPR